MQLMHEYVQKSTSTTLPRREASVSGRSPGVFSQCELPVNCGARPRTGSPRAGRLGRSRERVATAAKPVQPLLRNGRVLDVLLQRRRVAPERGLDLLVDVEDDRDRRQGDDDAHRAAQVLAAGAQPLRGPLTAERDQQHRPGGAERVREREQDAVEAEAMLRGENRDGRQHRPGAGDEDEPEADAEHEPADRGALRGGVS